MERPDDLKGRGVHDITGDELARVIAERKRRAGQREPFLAGDPTSRAEEAAAAKSRSVPRD